MNFEPDTKAKLRIILNHYRLLGLKDTLKESALYLLSRVGEDDFDRRYGVSTEGIIEPTEAGIQDEGARNLAIKYAPTREAVMRHILQHALMGQEVRRVYLYRSRMWKRTDTDHGGSVSFSSRRRCRALTDLSSGRRRQYHSIQSRSQCHTLSRHQSRVQQCSRLSNFLTPTYSFTCSDRFSVQFFRKSLIGCISFMCRPDAECWSPIPARSNNRSWNSILALRNATNTRWSLWNIRGTYGNVLDQRKLSRMASGQPSRWEGHPPAMLLNRRRWNGFVWIGPTPTRDNNMGR